MFLQQNIAACVPRFGPRLAIGDVVCGKFVIIAELARDENVTVFRVADGNRHLAVKLTTNISAFERETKALFTLKSIDDTCEYVSRVEGAAAHVEISTANLSPVIYGAIFTDYYPHGTLKAFMRVHTLQPRSAANVTKCIFKALKLLCAAGVVHADLNPRNLLVSNASANDFAVVLFDLDLAFESPRRVKSQQQPVQVTKADYVGTPGYIAPEVLERRGVCHESDIWSAFATVFELFTGKQMLDVFGDFGTVYTGGYTPAYIEEPMKKAREIEIQKSFIEHVFDKGIKSVVEANGGTADLTKFLELGFKRDFKSRPAASTALKAFKESPLAAN